MSKPKKSGNLAKSVWNSLHNKPGGKRIFSLLVGRFAPYTGSIGALVDELRPGHALVHMHDSRSVRNHLRSIHAIALANLAELAGNMAMTYSLPDDAQFIVKKMEIEYLKKARGTVRGIAECPIPVSGESRTYEVPIRILNEKDEVICQAVLHSLVGPKRS